MVFWYSIIENDGSKVVMKDLGKAIIRHNEWYGVSNK